MTNDVDHATIDKATMGNAIAHEATVSVTEQREDSAKSETVRVETVRIDESDTQYDDAETTAKASNLHSNVQETHYHSGDLHPVPSLTFAPGTKRNDQRKVSETFSRISLESLAPVPIHDNEKVKMASSGFHMLSWQRLSSCLICEAIALGALSLPKVFATLGMLPGIILTVSMGLASIYTSMIIGEVKYRNPQLSNYGEIGRLLFGRIGYRLVSFMLILLLVLTTGGHVLTGVIAFKTFASHSWCHVWYAVLSAVILFLLGLPKTFHKMAVLAYVDFASITLAILFTIIVSAVESHRKPGGIAATDWHWFLPHDKQSDFVTCVISLTNVALAYAYVQCLPSFMSEMRRPQDYKKAIWSLGSIQIVFYTLTGALIYGFKGANVKAPALLNLEPTMQKVGFAIALPVIFISGSINSQTAARFIYEWFFPPKSPHHYISTKLGQSVWIGLAFVITLIAWIAAEVIPSFETFFGLLAALFSACFSFTLPALVYMKVLRYSSPKSINAIRMHVEMGVNVVVFGFGCFMFFFGRASCVIALVRDYHNGFSAPFAC